MWLANLIRKVNIDKNDRAGGPPVSSYMLDHFMNFMAQCTCRWPTSLVALPHTILSVHITSHPTATVPKDSITTYADAVEVHMAPVRTTASFSAAAAMALPLSSHGPSHAPSLERGKACLMCRSRKVKCDAVRPACGACLRSASAHGEDPATLVCNFDIADQQAEKKRRASGGTKVANLEAKIAELESYIMRNELANGGTSEQRFGIASPQLSSDPSPSGSGSNYLDPLLATGDSSEYAYDTPESLVREPGGASSSFDALLQATGQQELLSGLRHDPTRLHPPRTSTDVQSSEAHSRVTSASGGVGSCITNSGSGFAPYPLLPPRAGYKMTPLERPGIPLAKSSIANPPDIGGSPPVGPGDDALLEIFYPGWPRDLPSPSLVSRLTEVYFQKRHGATGMIIERKLLASLALPPTHPDFPHSALVHSMLMTSARLVSEDFFSCEEKYWGKGEDVDETPAEYHAKRAKYHIDIAISAGHKIFQVAQAITLLCFHAYTSAKFVEVWLYCGLATRIVTPLGLNHIRPAIHTPTNSSHCQTRPKAKTHLLETTSDPEELYERATTFWFSVLCDRFASASTGWAMSLDEADISSLLPSLRHPHPQENETLSPLSIKNPNFMVAHPPHLVGSLQLYIKSVILLGRVVSFLQRAPNPIGMTQPLPQADPDAQVYIPDLRTTSGFRRMENDVLSFRLSIPREFQVIHNSTNDNMLTLVHGIPHAATILLHEPFCTLADHDISLGQCLQSARAILHTIYSLWSSSFDIGFLAPFVNWVWAVAGRTLVRELAVKQAKGEQGTEQVISDINVVIAAMRAYKSPLGNITALSLQHLLDHPVECLPEEDLSHLGLGIGRGASEAFTNRAKPGAPAGAEVTPIFAAAVDARRSGPGSTSPFPFESFMGGTAQFGHMSERFEEMLALDHLNGETMGSWK